MKKHAKLTMERYIAFVSNPASRSTLTVNQLNQIVFMHGFIKLHGWAKMRIVEALGALDLSPPTRSTVQGRDAASRAAGLLPEQVQKDTEAIGWGECHVQSVVIVGSAEAKVVEASSKKQSNPVEAAADGKKKRKAKRSGAEEWKSPKKTKETADVPPLLSVPLDSTSVSGAPDAV